jgi:hypothetical protein
MGEIMQDNSKLQPGPAQPLDVRQGHQTPGDTDALIEQINARLNDLSRKIVEPHAIAQIQAEVDTINDLLYSLRRRTELMAKLSDGSVPEKRRKERCSVLGVHHIHAEKPRPGLVYVVSESNELIQKATALIATAQQCINQNAHLSAGYELKPCALCSGGVASAGEACPACKGRGSVLVRQPAMG